jgi:hypothetical protein
MRIACCIPKATNTQSEYIILIAFPLLLTCLDVVLHVYGLSCSEVTRIHAVGYAHVEIIVTGLVRKFQTFNEN